MVEIKYLLKQLKEKHFEELILEIVIVELMVNGTEKHGKNLMNYKILTKLVIAQIIMMLMLISITSNVEHHKDFEKIKDGSIL